MAVDGNVNGNDAGDKARDAVLGPKAMGRNNRAGNVLRSVVPVGGSTKGGFGSLGNMGGDDARFGGDDHGDSTEYSSSFGPSCSVSDDETESDLNIMEVDSPFLGYDNTNVDDINSAPNVVRRKQVTSEWRKAVGPVMWRCHWLELRMKDLLSQVAKYDKELALINHQKDLQLEMVKADGPETEKLDYQSHERNIMRRRKRKRHEDIADTSLYMKRHHIFSYYENKNSGVETDGLLVNGGSDSLVAEDIKSSSGPGDVLLESIGNDRILERDSLGELVLAIAGIQSRIVRLQDCLTNACTKHEKSPPCLDHRLVKVPQKSQMAQNHLTSHKKDEKRSVQKTKDLNSLLQKDIGRPLVAVPSALSARTTDCMMGYMKGDITQAGAAQSDAKEITFEMLFGADNVLTVAQAGEFCKESADDVLIDNQAAKEEGYQQCEKIKQEEHSWLFKQVGEVSQEGYQQLGKVNETAEKHSELVNKVKNTPASKGVNTSARIIKCEAVQEIAPIAKHVDSGHKLGQKTRKKHGSSLPALGDQSEKSLQTPAKKKKVEKDPNNLKNEKPVLATETDANHLPKNETTVLVTASTRRSQRTRKPKIY